MAKYLRYYTSFVTREGHRIDARILQESETAFTPVYLEIGSGDSPLTIEWAETNKIDPIQGSTANLVVNSSSDRQLLHLAKSVAAGDVQLRVFRDNVLWWSGTLDSEGYEEPYTSGKYYDVILTFSDFGILNRLRWERTGRESYSTILQACLSRADIYYSQLLQNISTVHENNAALNLANIILDNANFYDEEGEALTCFEVLRGILQPFALRIVQRAGQICIYDLNAAASLQAVDVEWMGDDAMISHDGVTTPPYVSPHTARMSCLTARWRWYVHQQAATWSRPHTTVMRVMFSTGSVCGT